MDTLRQLAEETDGRAIVNRNDLLPAMKQIVRDSSAYYLLGYTSTVAPTDGKFHDIKVRVKRPGVQVRARKGYWALTAADVTRALAPPKAGAAEGGRDRARRDHGADPSAPRADLDRHRTRRRTARPRSRLSGSRCPERRATSCAARSSRPACR